jgi:SHS family lactate transporter-like MFS transporter
MRSLEPRLGWQWMFYIGMAPAIIIVVLTALSNEPPSWQRERAAGFGEIFRIVAWHKWMFAFLVLLMGSMTCLSHGTQDLYPDFLKSVHHFSNTLVSNIAILYNIGAITGSIFIGFFSDHFGRRRATMLALGISLLAIPVWAFGGSLSILLIGSFIMQFGVQGTFGVIPAHLNELAPGSVRSLFTGVVYQLGMLIGAPSVIIEFALQKHFGYQWSLAGFEACVIVALFLIFGFGPTPGRKDFSS